MEKKITCQNCDCIFDCDLDDLNNYKTHYTRRGRDGGAPTYYMAIHCPRCDLRVLSFKCSESKHKDILRLKGVTQ